MTAILTVQTAQAGKRSKLQSPVSAAKRPVPLESLPHPQTTFQLKCVSAVSPSEAKVVPAQLPEIATGLFKAMLSREGGEVC